MTAVTITWEAVQLGALLGKDSSGEVYQAIWLGKKVAVKQLLIKNPSHFQKEAEKLSSCQIEQLVKIWGLCQKDDHLALVMEFMEKGSLHDVLHDQNRELPWKPLRLRIALDISKGLAYLHNKNVLHGNLTSRNVLLTEGENAKLTDFGLNSLKLASESLGSSSLDNVRWLAPELFSEHAKYTNAADIYSLGLVFWEIATRKLPFEEETSQDSLIQRIQKGMLETKKIANDCPDEFKNAIDQCCTKPADKRSTILKVIATFESLLFKPIQNYQDLLKAVIEDLSSAEYSLKAALASDGPQSFRRLFSTSEQIEEIVKFMPSFTEQLYFVHGQCLNDQGDLKTAVDYYLKAAKMGFTRAQVLVGSNYLQGKGIKQDKAEAFKWLSEAATHGHVRAQLNLGMMLEHGDGVPQDIDAARYWYQKAAHQGNENALKYLLKLSKKADAGDNYFAQGYLFEKQGQASAAFKEYEKAAELGHMPAHDKLAIAYLKGEGVGRDRQKAFHLFLEAAQLGFPKSMYNAALMLELGDGIAVNLQEARRWYMESASKGNSLAEERLKQLKIPNNQKLAESLEKTLEKYSSDIFWHIDPAAKVKLEKNESYSLIKAGKSDFEKVLRCYQNTPVQGYDLANVEIIYNPTMESAFTSRISQLEHRASNDSFKPNFDKEKNPQWRKKILKDFKKQALPYADSNFQHVTILPGWHGTNPKILDSIFKIGYANLATTDVGYFGKGIYSAFEADYAQRVYSKGALILNWVAMFSPYPVIDGDLTNLMGKGVYANFDAHIAPVVPSNPNNPNEKVFMPCKENQAHKYLEMVVFESAACFPRYLVELQPSLPKSLTIVEAKPKKNKKLEKSKQ